jgi:K+-transporting ATPase A subunit
MSDDPQRERFSKRVFLWSTVFIVLSLVVAILLVAWVILYALQKEKNAPEVSQIGVHRLLPAGLAASIDCIKDRVED